jgi:hypothetical protein
LDDIKPHLSYIQKMSWEAPAELHAGNLDAAFAYARPEDDAIAARSNLAEYILKSVE